MKEIAETGVAGLKWMHIKSRVSCVNCSVHRYHLAYVLSVSMKPPPSFLLLINVIDCESEVNDFPPTTEDALAFTIRHHLQSILPTEITASIIGGDTHKTTGTPAGRWLIQTGASLVPQVHNFTLKETLKAAIKDRWTSRRVYQYRTYARKAHFR